MSQIEGSERFVIRQSVLDVVEQFRELAWPINNVAKQMASNEMEKMEAKIIQDYLKFDAFEAIERPSPRGSVLMFKISRYPDYMATLDGSTIDQLFGYLFDTGLTKGRYSPEERAGLVVSLLEHSQGVEWCIGNHNIRPERLPKVEKDEGV